METKTWQGNIMPQALEAEKALLGAILANIEIMPEVVDILKADDFYLLANQVIWKAMKTLYKSKKLVDLVTLPEQLIATKELEAAGGISAILQMSSMSAGNLEHAIGWANIIYGKSTLRTLIKACQGIITRAFESPMEVQELVDEAQGSINQIGQGLLGDKIAGMSEVIPEVVKKLEEASQKDGSITGVPTGYTDFDEMTAGLQPGDLVIIAARPGMGKTALAINIAHRLAKNYKQNCAFFSLEMTKVQLGSRLLGIDAHLPGSKLKSGNLDDDEWKQVANSVERLGDLGIFIDDSSGLNILELKSKARRLVKFENCKLIMIDYLQLMKGTAKRNGNREQEISEISRELKALAKELGVPIIALSQLSRAVESRGGDKRPMLSDLRESGAIEQDADIVSFVYRPAYYQILEDEEGNSLKQSGEWIIAKHRNGSTDTVQLKWIDFLMMFENKNSVVRGDDINLPRQNDQDIPF